MTDFETHVRSVYKPLNQLWRSWYKQLLEIRVLRQGLADQGVTEDGLESVDAHADSQMERGIDEVVEDLLESYGENLSEERTNELRTELKLVLNALANRIDEGYQIDVRSGPVGEGKQSDDEESEDDSDARYATIIQQLRPGMQFLNASGVPILSLPEPNAEEE